MPRSQAEFALTLDIPCSAGFLAYDIETRVTVEYEFDAGSIAWELIDVRLDGEPGVIRKGSDVFFLFENAVALPKYSMIVTQECHDDWQSKRAGDPDELRDRRIERELEAMFA